MLFFRQSQAKSSSNIDAASSSSGEAQAVRASSQDATNTILTDGTLQFGVAQGGNGSLPSYQEVSGAPVETSSPLGYSVGPITVIFLNVSKMIGTGVYSTRKRFCRHLLLGDCFEVLDLTCWVADRVL